MSVFPINLNKGKYLVVYSILLSVVILGGCKVSTDMNDRQARAKVEQQVGMKFCDSIEWLYCSRYTFGAGYVCTVFRIPKKDIDSLFHGIPVNWEEKYIYLFDNKDIPAKYNPRLIKKIKSFQVNHPTKYDVLSGLYDNSSTDEDEKVLFYLIWFKLE